MMEQVGQVGGRKAGLGASWLVGGRAGGRETT